MKKRPEKFEFFGEAAKVAAAKEWCVVVKDGFTFVELYRNLNQFRIEGFAYLDKNGEKKYKEWFDDYADYWLLLANRWIGAR